MLSVSPIPLVVEYRFVVVQFLDLPCLDLGIDSNLTSKDMGDIRLQGVSIDDENDPDMEKIPYKVPQP